MNISAMAKKLSELCNKRDKLKHEVSVLQYEIEKLYVQRRLLIHDGDFDIPGDHIIIAKGTSECDRMSGPVTISIEKEFYCSDIYVHHRFDDTDLGAVAEDEGFMEEIIGVLKRSGAIPHKNKYELHRAELGMQTDEYAVFEGLFKDGKFWSDIFCKKHGGKRMKA